MVFGTLLGGKVRNYGSFLLGSEVWDQKEAAILVRLSLTSSCSILAQHSFLMSPH